MLLDLLPRSCGLGTRSYSAAISSSETFPGRRSASKLLPSEILQCSTGGYYGKRSIPSRSVLEAITTDKARLCPGLPYSSFFPAIWHIYHFKKRPWTRGRERNSPRWVPHSMLDLRLFVAIMRTLLYSPSPAPPYCPQLHVSCSFCLSTKGPRHGGVAPFPSGLAPQPLSRGSSCPQLHPASPSGWQRG